MNLLLATIIGLSLSYRTPNDSTKPLDYEIAVKSAKEQGNFQYYVKRDWERELGEKFIDTEFEVTQIATIDGVKLYGGMKYLDKKSKSLQYNQVRLGFALPLVNFGIAKTTETTMMNATFKKILKNNKFEYKLYIDLATDLQREVWDIKGEARRYFNKNVHVYALFNKEYIEGKVDEHYKVGIGYKF